MQQKQLKAKKREAYGGTHEGLRWLCVGPGKRKACTGHSVAPWCCPGSPHRPHRWPHRWPGTRPCQSGICQNGHCSYSLQTKTDRRYLAPRFLALAPLLSTFNTGLLVIHIISVSQTDYSNPLCCTVGLKNHRVQVLQITMLLLQVCFAAVNKVYRVYTY